MSDAVKEQLSACLDGQLPRAELALLVKRVERDGELRDTMSRYALMGEALRHEKPVVASRDFAAGVMAVIVAEPARPAGRVPAVLLRRLRPIAGVAVAAGVAAVAILSIQHTGTPDTMAGQVVSNPTATAPNVVESVAQDINPSYVVPGPNSSPTPAFAVPAARLTNYVVAHSEYSSPLGRRSVLTGVLADDGAADDAEPMTVVNDETRDAAPQPQER